MKTWILGSICLIVILSSGCEPAGYNSNSFNPEQYRAYEQAREHKLVRGLGGVIFQQN